MEKAKERLVELQNRQGGRVSFRLRPYRPGEEAGLIACIAEEYGETYFKRELYRPEQIRREAESGRIVFLAAERISEGEKQPEKVMAPEIAGMLILKQFYPEETMCEVASQIFRKKYRGYGLAMPFFEYGMEILEEGGYSAAYCLPVMFHDITQRLLYRLGFRAAGLVLNVFHMGKITHSYKRDRNQKHSQGIQIKMEEKKNAGTLYVPKEHRNFCAKRYDTLGAAYQMAEDAENGKKVLPDFCSMSVSQNEEQCSMTIRLHTVGADLAQRIGEIHRRYPFTGMQTANIFLNVNDVNAVWAYRMLVRQGYFFTGLKPLCAKQEYMVLHHAGEVQICFEDYAASPEFRELINYIEERKGQK